MNWQVEMKVKLTLVATWFSKAIGRLKTGIEWPRTQQSPVNCRQTPSPFNLYNWPPPEENFDKNRE